MKRNGKVNLIPAKPVLVQVFNYRPGLGYHKITKCKLLSQKENEFVFDVVLSDNSHQLNYPITVKVIKKDHQFFIADVLQEDIQP